MAGKWRSSTERRERARQAGPASTERCLPSSQRVFELLLGEGWSWEDEQNPRAAQRFTKPRGELLAENKKQKHFFLRDTTSREADRSLVEHPKFIYTPH
ncbi:Hypothetical predicted protein [Marmota monax]|uniref:Uncharacterized protein n=1 Tax=Marmota monax TaxID=9995 RepID=A0A5E4A6Q9_MARMO|nr:hypothetical protein GHT09_006446 [Marmota monax]VTJ52957.1 Hypothetical predicted protein [Marmota monax]